MTHRWDSRTYLDRFKYLSIAELRDMLEDEERIDWLVRVGPQMQKHQRQKEIKWGSNRRLAERNLSYQPFLNNNKLLLAERYRVLGQLSFSVKHKQKELNRLHGLPVSLGTSQRCQEERVIDLADISEDLWNTFIRGDLLLADFVKSFRRARALYHQHLVMMDKLLQFTRGRRARARGAAVPPVSESRAPNAVHVFHHHLSPVVIFPPSLHCLTGLSLKSRYLPPLNHGHGDLWRPSICNDNPDNSRESRTCPERLDQMRYNGPKDQTPKHSQ